MFLLFLRTNATVLRITAIIPTKLQIYSVNNNRNDSNNKNSEIKILKIFEIMIMTVRRLNVFFIVFYFIPGGFEPEVKKYRFISFSLPRKFWKMLSKGEVMFYIQSGLSSDTRVGGQNA